MFVFDRAAHFYDETRGFPPREEKSIAALIAKAGNFTPLSHILEVGIGTGRIALPLSAHVGSVAGVDLSAGMLNRLIAKKAEENIHLAQADVTRLPFKNGMFDAVIAAHIYHLVPNWIEGLHEAARVLKPGAPLLNCWNNETGQNSINPLFKVFSTAVPQQAERRPAFKWDQYGTFPESQGWRRDGDTQIHTYSVLRSPQKFVEQQQARVWSSTWALTDEELARGIAALEAYIAANFDDPRQPVEEVHNFHVQAYLPPRDMGIP